jgi:hypothetical protein
VSCVRIQSIWRVFSLRRKFLKLLAIREAAYRCGRSPADVEFLYAALGHLVYRKGRIPWFGP